MEAVSRFFSMVVTDNLVKSGFGSAISEIDQNGKSGLIKF
jgi:hypothetical protein